MIGTGAGLEAKAPKRGGTAQPGLGWSTASLARRKSHPPCPAPSSQFSRKPTQNACCSTTSRFGMATSHSGFHMNREPHSTARGFQGEKGMYQDHDRREYGIS